MAQLTDSMQKHSPFWEADSSSERQDIFRILWNSKVHYRIHNSLSLVSILGDINPVRTLAHRTFYIHFNIILPF
jgi:hypothetical protein